MASPSVSSSSTTNFTVLLSYQGQTIPVSNVTTTMTGMDLYRHIAQVLSIIETDEELKILYKGKRISKEEDTTSIIFPTIPTKPPKLIVLTTPSKTIQEMATKKSDPTIRNFEQEEQRRRQHQQEQEQQMYWGSQFHRQSKDYKFCRFQACTWQSFGHRPSDSTPHDFAALALLQRLATDPGIVAIMTERELVVGTLGEMDPIDDRIMQKKQQEQQGSCLLGYNTNGGARIDIKLRTDDLKGFRPYPQLVETLIHELSHNWVGEHNLLFWTNYAQMRAEYLYKHASLRSTIVHGKTTAELAGLDTNELDHVFETVMNGLVREMAQFGLHPNMIVEPIRQRCDELDRTSRVGHRLGGSSSTNSNVASRGHPASVRERAFEAAERRAREQKEKET